MAEKKEKSLKKAEKKESSSKKAEKKTNSDESSPKPKSEPNAQNGKGDGPRNIFSEEFRSNFDSIDWSK